MAFTKGQEIAHDGIIEFIQKGYVDNDFKRALMGAAGTGKSYLMKSILLDCGLADSVIGLAAPTHKAARVIEMATGKKASTIASDLGLRLNYDSDNFDINNPPFDPKAEKKIKNYKLYIVDEASMISTNLKILLERECQEYECQLLYCGDPYQLPPVNERVSPCFTEVKRYELTEIVRQEEGNPVKDLLALLRFDIERRSWKFLEHISANRFAFDESQTRGYYCCGRYEFESLVQDGFYRDEFTKNVDLCRLVTYTNASVSNWNKFIRNNIVNDAHKAIITRNDLIMSYNTLVEPTGDTIITNSEDYIIGDLSNFQKSDGLYGFNVRFIQVNGGRYTKPLFIVDHSNHLNLALYYQNVCNLIDEAKGANAASRAIKWKNYYKYREENLLLVNIVDRATGKIKISRDLDYGFAITSHRAQGSTYTDVYVDVNDIVFNMKTGTPWANIDETLRRLYVACSRCKNRLFLCYGK